VKVALHVPRVSDLGPGLALPSQEVQDAVSSLERERSVARVDTRGLRVAHDQRALVRPLLRLRETSSEDRDARRAVVREQEIMGRVGEHDRAARVEVHIVDLDERGAQRRQAKVGSVARRQVELLGQL